MKKILSIVVGCSIVFLLSCNNEKTESADKTANESKSSSMADKNREISHMVVKSFETGEVSGLDSVIADDFVDHTDRGDVIGRDSLKAMITMVHKNFGDMKTEILSEGADDDYVYTRMRFKGTGDGVMMPAGPYDMHTMEVTRFKSGKAVEHWGFMDMQNVMKMMAPPAPSKKTPAPPPPKK